MSTVIQLLIVLGIMVLVHEFGHFAVAKLCGIRVEIFSIGFGKRLFGIKRGDTDYRISILPLGGYVKMAGDNPGEAPSGDPGEFNAHPRWQRIAVALAGPFANFILAIALVATMYMFHFEKQEYLAGPAVVDYVSPNSAAAKIGLHPGDTVVHFDATESPKWEDIAIRSVLNLNHEVPFSFVHDGQRTDTTLFLASKDSPDKFTLDTLGLVPRMQAQPIQILRVVDGTPAQRAGLKPNDVIASINGITLHSVGALLDYLQDQAGKPADLLILRAGQTLPIVLTPQQSDTGDGTKAYRIGFAPAPPPVIVEKLPFGSAVGESWIFFKKNSLLIRDVLQGMFTHRVSVKMLSGPIGIGQQVHEAIQMPGWSHIVELMAGISINLGIFNLLPIPILDGGMILFLLIESLFRRDINQEFKERVYQVAFVCLLCFAAFVIFNDVTKLGLFSKLKP
jgi:regulator of sigma E protease